MDKTEKERLIIEILRMMNVNNIYTAPHLYELLRKKSVYQFNQENSIYRFSIGDFAKVIVELLNEGKIRIAKHQILREGDPPNYHLSALIITKFYKPPDPS